MSLAEPVLQGNRLALARLLTQIENEAPEGIAALSELFPYTGQAHLIGVTGAPGTGKSSLVNQLARCYRQPAACDGQERREPCKVGVVAVDPSSPFSGGAILGDRVRMRDLSGDPGVFIRSMASRGSLGGLARATAGIVQALDAAGFQVVIIETVGAGQSEVDIARLAHTTLVIEAPGLGDDIQAIKAGILEIADVLVINKADHAGVEATERALRSMLQLGHPSRYEVQHHRSSGDAAPVFTPPRETPMWVPPVCLTVAPEGKGIGELAGAIAQHREFLQRSGEWQERERSRLQAEIDLLLAQSLMRRWREGVPQDRYQAVLENVFQRSLSPWQAVSQLIDGGWEPGRSG